MPKPARKLPNFTDATKLLKSVVCGHCGGLRLPKQECMDCIARIELHKQHPELLQANNWRLRSSRSKRRSYLTKRRHALQEQLTVLEYKLQSVQPQKQSGKLLSTQHKVMTKLQAVEQELKETAPQEKPKDDTEIVLQCLQSINAYAHQGAADQLRYEGAGII